MPDESNPRALAEVLRSARDTRCLEIGEHILSETPRVFRTQFGERRAIIVADPNTLAAAGQGVHDVFRTSGQALVDPFVFREPDFFAENRFVAALESALRQHDSIPVAVGSGTINDITKLAAHRAGRPYMCVATAASMDGYAAYGASITHEGSKQTFNCPAPPALLADLEVIRAAPPGMNAWGYADLLAKVTAGADWLVADALGEEPIEPRAWAIIQGPLRELVADPAGVRAGAPNAIHRLIEGLMRGGFAMQTAQSSRPASGAEHQFSHLWDMEHQAEGQPAPPHGLKVGIGTLAMAALYECLLAESLDQLDVRACAAAWPDQPGWVQRAHGLFPPGHLRDVAAREATAKHLSASQLQRQLEKLRGLWSELTDLLRRQLLAFASLREMLQLAGAATEPEQIGISRERLRESFWRAFFLRRRFTVLDLAVRTGRLDASLDKIFAPAGIWPRALQDRARSVRNSD